MKGHFTFTVSGSPNFRQCHVDGNTIHFGRKEGNMHKTSPWSKPEKTVMIPVLRWVPVAEPEDLHQPQEATQNHYILTLHPMAPAVNYSSHRLQETSEADGHLQPQRFRCTQHCQPQRLPGSTGTALAQWTWLQWPQWAQVKDHARESSRNLWLGWDLRQSYQAGITATSAQIMPTGTKDSQGQMTSPKNKRVCW